MVVKKFRGQLKKLTKRAKHLFSKVFFAHPLTHKQIKYALKYIVEKDIRQISQENKAEATEELMQEAKKRVKKHSESKGRWFALCTFLLSVIIMVFVLYFQSKSYHVDSIEDFFTIETRFKYLALCVVAFIAIMIAKTIRKFVLVYSTTKQARLVLSYKSSALAKYYEVLTPFGSGGQAYDTYYLNNRGVKAGFATSVPMLQTMAYQITFTIIALVVLLAKFSLFGEDSLIVIILGIVSIVLFILQLIFFLFLSFSKKYAPRIIAWCVKILYKLRIIKNFESALSKAIRTTHESQRSTAYLFKNIGATLCTILMTAIIIVLNAFLPYLIYCIFYVPTSGVFIEIFAKYIICNLAVRCVPLPGGVGISELTFATVFSNMFTGGTLFWAMLLWRTFSFYIYLLQGAVISVYDLLWGNAKNARKRMKNK